MRTSAEGECKGLDARIEKLDLEQSIADRLRLSDQLVGPLFGDRAVALLVDIRPVSSTRCLSINADAKPHGGTWRCRSHDEMQIAGMKAICDPPIALVQLAEPLPHRPISGQGPMVQPQLRRGCIHSPLVQCLTAGGGKVFGTLIA